MGVERARLTEWPRRVSLVYCVYLLYKALLRRGTPQGSVSTAHHSIREVYGTSIGSPCRNDMLRSNADTPSFSLQSFPTSSLCSKQPALPALIAR